MGTGNDYKFSTFPPHIKITVHAGIDFAAPGGDYYSDIKDPYDLVLSPASVDKKGIDYWWSAAGTSMTSPHVGEWQVNNKHIWRLFTCAGTSNYKTII